MKIVPPLTDAARPVDRAQAVLTKVGFTSISLMF
jgi:hypothetical protein